MKKTLVLAVSLLIFHFSCQKKDNFQSINVSPGLASVQATFATQAINFLEKNLDHAAFSQLDFSNSRVIAYRSEDRFFMVYDRDQTSSAFILLERSGTTTFKGYRNILKTNPGDESSGYFSSEPLDGSPGHEVTWKKNQIQKVIYRNESGRRRSETRQEANNSFDSLSSGDLSSRSATVVSASEEPNPPAQMLPTVTFTKVVQNTSFTFTSLYFSTNFNPAYFYTYTPPSNVNPTGGGGINPDRSVDVPMHGRAPSPPTIDIYQELKCFSNVPGAQYSVRLNIRQPSPNTRETFVLPDDVGHAWLTLEQVNPNGTVTRRNIGFYPTALSMPGVPLAPSAWKDNSADKASVTLKVTITGTEMVNIKNSMTGSYHSYNFESYNCTHAATSVFQTIGVTLPSGVGSIYYTAFPTNVSIPVYTGKNPGDLGQDIRNMNLSGIPAWRNVQRITSVTNNITNMPKSGSCL